MITIHVEELFGQVRRVPAAEYFVNADPGEFVFLIDLTDEITLQLRQDDAEDLFLTLATHFAGL